MNLKDDFLTIQEFKKIHQSMHNSSFLFGFIIALWQNQIKMMEFILIIVFIFDNQVRSDYFEFLNRYSKVKSKIINDG